jgi:hypothetical protein
MLLNELAEASFNNADCEVIFVSPLSAQHHRTAHLGPDYSKVPLHDAVEMEAEQKLKTLALGEKP